MFAPLLVGTVVHSENGLMFFAPFVFGMLIGYYNSPLNAAPNKPFFKPSSSRSFCW